MQKHRNLAAWRLCRDLAVEVYRVTSTFPASERFGLTAQLRGAATSAASNIAEGCARKGTRELAHFLSNALGSLAEIDSLLEIAAATGSLTAADRERLDAIRSEASRTTFGLQRAVRQRAGGDAQTHRRADGQ